MKAKSKARKPREFVGDGEPLKDGVYVVICDGRRRALIAERGRCSRLGWSYIRVGPVPRFIGEAT